MTPRDMLKSWAMGLLLSVMLLWGTTLNAAVPAAWKDGGYALNADNMTVRAVLDDFGRSHGVRIEMSGAGGRRVKGRLKADNALDFINRLAAAHNLRWFVYNATLYVGAGDDNTSARMQVGENAVQDAKTALVGLGLFDERFGWGELPDEGVVIVSGPRAYVDLARGVLMPEQQKERLRGRHVMLFRLKYASAMDRVINSRGKAETIPGIRTILSNLLLGNHGGSGEKVSAGDGFEMASTKRSRTGKNGRGEVREVSQDGGENRFMPLFAAPGASARNRIDGPAPGAYESASDDDGARKDGARESRKEAPRIEADPTLNAIMIYDDVAKREVYATLINQLDVKPQQVEIEALIVDIDRSRLAEMGVEWGLRVGAVNTMVNGTSGESSGTDLPLPGATLLISNAARFYARLKAMESKGEARVLATPSVLTLDNVAAVLDLSQSAYVPLVGERVADISDITAGTRLRVIPRIIDDNGNIRIRLEVDIEDGSIDTDASRSNGKNGNNGVLGTSVTRSTISTQAIIDAQQTLMIGGYRAESMTRDRQKVPLLGDIPVLGGLFRTEAKSNSTRERLFLITPRITGSDGKRVLASAAPAVAPAHAPLAAPVAAPGAAPGPNAPVAMPPVPVPTPGKGAPPLPAPAAAATANGAAARMLPLPPARPPVAAGAAAADVAAPGIELKARLKVRCAPRAAPSRFSIGS